MGFTSLLVSAGFSDEPALAVETAPEAGAADMVGGYGKLYRWER